MKFRVQRAGSQMLSVGARRNGRRHLGIPAGGAADRAAWMLGNALLGNPPETPASEIALSGPTLEVDEPATLVVFGADFQLERDGHPISSGTTFSLFPGQILRIGPVRSGLRGYLCSRADGGIAAGRSLISVHSAEVLERGLPSGVIRVIDGPQTDWFSQADFLSREWTVSVRSNRMGVRLEGRPLDRPERELLSEPVAPGAVQITNEGLPILLGIDGQTIGGYPKIAHAISADLDQLAQLAPGTTIRFERVSVAEAEALGREYREKLANRLTRLRVLS